MFSWFNFALSSGPLNVRVSRTLLSVANVATGARWEEAPLVAIRNEPGKPKAALAFGGAARNISGEIVNPFDHPRILIADYAVGERLMRHAFRSVLSR